MANRHVQRIIIVGAGGFGREVFALLRAITEIGLLTFDLLGFVDDGEVNQDRLARLGASVIGDVDSVAHLDALYLIGVGKPTIRRGIDERLQALGAVPASPVTHPRSWIGPDVELGVGSIVCAGVSITTNVRAGRHVHFHLNTAVGHDSTMGDFVTIAPLSAISGNVTLETGVELGTGVAVLPGIRVGAGTLVGANSTVTRDLPAGVIALGSPAKPRRASGLQPST
jgi:sugar O-acyltransferase (sialic acid O-acetyltransferase NeuD family)